MRRLDTLRSEDAEPDVRDLAFVDDAEDRADSGAANANEIASVR